MKFISRPIAMSVEREGEGMLSEYTTTVRIVDEGAGEFVEVEQQARSDLGKIAIASEEWPTLREAIYKMLASCRPDEVKEQA